MLYCLAGAVFLPGAYIANRRGYALPAATIPSIGDDTVSEDMRPPGMPGPINPFNAVAVVAGSPAYPNIRGTVRFAQTRGGVIVKADVNGLPQTPSGFFAFHLHDGTCNRRPWPRQGEETAAPEAQADYFPETGGHYNPGRQPHPRHAGDFPSLLATRNGSAQLTFLTDRFTVLQALGRAVVIHLNPDDYRTQPAGDSGPKIACGLVVTERGPGLY